MREIGVIGSGLMGSGIAQVAAQSGLHVLMTDQQADALRGAVSNIEKGLLRLHDRGRLEEDVDLILTRIQTTTELNDFARLDVVIEAIFAFQEGIATREDIDQAVKLGLGHPMGPLTLADLVGLDTLLSVCKVYYREFGDSKYRPPILLRRYVAAGWLGRKSGKGFYDYAPREA